MLSWHHSGFNIYCGPTIWPHDEDALENPARYIVRASFSQERMTYIPADQSPEGEARVIYQSKDGTTTKTFHALDWLARLTTHIPNKNEQMVRYYGFYSNKSGSVAKLFRGYGDGLFRKFLCSNRKQVFDELNLTFNIPFFYTLNLSFSDHVHCLKSS